MVAVRPALCLWVLWPRRAAGHLGDVTSSQCAVMLPFDVMDAEVTTAGENRSGREFMSRQEIRPGRVRWVRRRQEWGSAGTPQAAADTGADTGPVA